MADSEMGVLRQRVAALRPWPEGEAVIRSLELAIDSLDEREARAKNDTAVQREVIERLRAARFWAWVAYARTLRASDG